jgi:hypothetical protein
MQGNPNKSKEKSLDSFGRFGAFQWVTANPNKKICSRRNSRFRLYMNAAVAGPVHSPFTTGHSAARSIGQQKEK